MRGCITGILLLASGAALAGDVTHGSWHIQVMKDDFTDTTRSVMWVQAEDHSATFGYFCQSEEAALRLELPMMFDPRQSVEFAVRANGGEIVVATANPAGAGLFYAEASSPELISDVLHDGNIALRVSQGGVAGRDFRFHTSGTLEAAIAFFEGCGVDLSEAKNAG